MLFGLGVTTDETAGWGPYGPGDAEILREFANRFSPKLKAETPWYLAGGINWVVIAGVAGSLLVLTLLLRKK